MGAMLEHAFMQHAVLAGLCAGVSCGLMGVFVVTMHLSMLGICIAHAAFAGAMLGIWMGFEPIWGALAFSLAAAAFVGPLADRGQLNPDSAVGIVFSFMLGLAFLFVGLTPGAKTHALSLFWGSILTVSTADLAYLAAVTVLLVMLLTLFFKEIQAVVCHRRVALAVGIPATVVFYGLLFATGATVAVSLRTVGGLLIYSLLLNPAAAAFQLTFSLKRMFVLAAAFGVVSCWLGLAGSCFWDLPTGASIVIASTLLFAAALAVSPKRRMMAWRR